jgi:hypothetical protein
VPLEARQGWPRRGAARTRNLRLGREAWRLTSRASRASRHGQPYAIESACCCSRSTTAPPGPHRLFCRRRVAIARVTHTRCNRASRGELRLRSCWPQQEGSRSMMQLHVQEQLRCGSIRCGGTVYGPAPPAPASQSVACPDAAASLLPNM